MPPVSTWAEYCRPLTDIVGDASITFPVSYVLRNDRLHRADELSCAPGHHTAGLVTIDSTEVTLSARLCRACFGQPKAKLDYIARSSGSPVSDVVALAPTYTALAAAGAAAGNEALAEFADRAEGLASRALACRDAAEPAVAEFAAAVAATAARFGELTGAASSHPDRVLAVWASLLTFADETFVDELVAAGVSRRSPVIGQLSRVVGMLSKHGTACLDEFAGTTIPAMLFGYDPSAADEARLLVRVLRARYTDLARTRPAVLVMADPTRGLPVSGLFTDGRTSGIRCSPLGNCVVLAGPQGLLERVRDATLRQSLAATVEVHLVHVDAADTAFRLIFEVAAGDGHPAAAEGLPASDLAALAALL